jgi:hypothetical protein
MGSRLKELVTEGWRHASTIIFVFGFASDSFFLPSFDAPITKYLGLTYLVVIAVILLLREWVVERNTATDIERKLFSLLTFGLSFFLGSALSFVFIYSMRSAALVVSWPLFLILLVCMVANEYVSTHNYRFTLDIAVYFIALVFYCIFHVPILFGAVNDFVFLVAVGISVAVGVLFVFVLRKSSETAEHESPRAFALAIGIPMFVGMLYMLNVIPAVPLSLKESGIYHDIERSSDGGYTGGKEVDKRFFAKYRSQTFHKSDEDNAVYYFSSVGAPAELSAPITHVWEYYDESSRSWVTSTTVSFELSGGRQDGYRAYSKKEHVFPGLWRVTVKVGSSRIVGRMTFRIENGNATVQEIRL